MRILVVNGPNLNMLGTREPEKYGSKTLAQINDEIKQFAFEKGIEVEFFQSNIEGEIVDKIQSAKGTFDGLILNPAAYTHTSVAIRDALLEVQIPTIEVHLSNVYSREDFRQTTYTAGVCLGQIAGMGDYGYKLAILALAEKLK